MQKTSSLIMEFLTSCLTRIIYHDCLQRRYVTPLLCIVRFVHFFQDHNLLCIDIVTGGIYALPSPPRAFYGTQLGVSCYKHEVMVHAVSRSELHEFVLNRFKRTEGTWDVSPVRDISMKYGGDNGSGG